MNQQVTPVADTPALESLRLTVDGAILQIELARPDKRNALHALMWREIADAIAWFDDCPGLRVAVISGAGRHFSAGIDLEMLASFGGAELAPCGGRTRENIRRAILEVQASINAIERCRKPVIAAVHGACLGAAVDLICACDLRYSTADARLVIKEIDVGAVADLGTLQRLPRLIGEGLTRELAYTGRELPGDEARQCGFVIRTWPSRDELMQEVLEIARCIAAKSPLALRGTKEMITYARDHSVADGLNYVATWNAAMMQSSDFEEIHAAAAERRPPVFLD